VADHPELQHYRNEEKYLSQDVINECVYDGNVCLIIISLTIKIGIFF